jgi:hypothetical protein
MMTNTGDISVIMDFGTQTITTVNDAAKTYAVKKFSDMPGPAGFTDVTFDIKETGQKKVIDGFNTSETIVTMTMDMELGHGVSPANNQVEMDLWISSDVPGAGDMRAFCQKNLANFPWAAMTGGSGNPAIQKAMMQMERKLAQLNGMAVERVIRVKSSGGAGAPKAAQMPQMNEQAQMPAPMAKLQQMQSQGGPQAAAAQQAMATMGGMTGGSAPGSASGAGSLLEMRIDATGFSNASVPDSVFAIPAGYKQIE